MWKRRANETLRRRHGYNNASRDVVSVGGLSAQRVRDGQGQMSINVFVWYVLSPTQWVRCTEYQLQFGGLAAVVADGYQYNNLRTRQIAGAILCYK
jgi:hypothetical protein